MRVFPKTQKGFASLLTVVMIIAMLVCLPIISAKKAEANSGGGSVVSDVYGAEPAQIFFAAASVPATDNQIKRDISFSSNNTLPVDVVPVDTTWVLQFDQELNISTVTGENIYVTDAGGETADVTVFCKDYRTVLVVPTEPWYKKNHQYTLMIKDIRSDSGDLLEDLQVNFITELRRWEADEKDFTMGEMEGDYRKLDAQGPSGLFFYTMLTDLSLAEEENFQVMIRAGIEKNGELTTSNGDSDPVVFTMSLYEDRNNPICKDLEVRASDIGENFTDLSFLFTRPENQPGKTLIMQLNYCNSDEDNIYNLKLDQITVKPLLLDNVNGSLINSSRIINAAVVNHDNAYAPDVQTNLNLDLQPLHSGNFQVTYVSDNAQQLQQDTDGDGIYDELEKNGFIYSFDRGLESWNGNDSIKYYKTDSTQWSTDGDPYGDMNELTGSGMDSAVKVPGNDPLVAAFPKISMEVTRFTIVPVEEITLSNNRSISKEFTENTSTTDSYTNENKLGGEISNTGVSANYEHTWIHEESVTIEQSTTNGTAKEWGSATTTDPSEAAYLKLHVKLKNSGTATARDVMPTFSIYIGNKPVTTIQMPTVSVLRPGSETEEFTIDSDTSTEFRPPITLSLEELKALKMGAPLRLRLMEEQTEAKVSRWNMETNSWEKDADWIDSKTQIDSRSVTLVLAQGDSSKEYHIFAGNEYYNPELSLRQALMHVADVEERADGVYINGEKFSHDWIIGFADIPENYFTKNPPQDDDVFNSILVPGMQVFLAKSDPGPKIKWVNYNRENNSVEVLPVPGIFAIKNIQVGGTLSGVEHWVDLSLSEDKITYEVVVAEYFVPRKVKIIDARNKVSVFEIDQSNMGDDQGDTQDNYQDFDRDEFFQGVGYQAGAYDLNAAQPTAFNWTRQSRYTASPYYETVNKQQLSTESGVQVAVLGEIHSSPAIGSDGTIYMGIKCGEGSDKYGYLLALNSDGSTKWSRKLDSWVISSPTIDKDGFIYVAAGRKVYAFNPDGTKKYSIDICGLWDGNTYDSERDRMVYSSPAIDEDGIIYFVTNSGCEDSWDYAIEDLKVLEPYWEEINAAAYLYGGVVNFDNIDLILEFIGADIRVGRTEVQKAVGELVAIDKFGDVKWHKRLPHWSYSSPVIGVVSVEDEFGDVSKEIRIYVGSEEEGAITAFGPDGEKKWEKLIWKDTTYKIAAAPVIGDDGTIYVGVDVGDGANDGDRSGLFALNPDGTEKWRTNEPIGFIKSSPAIARDGTIYVGTTIDYNGDGLFRLCAINPEDGKVKWKFGGDAGYDGKMVSSPIIGFDGTIYFGTTYGFIYAVNPDGTRKWRLYTKEDEYVIGEIYSSPAIGANGVIYFGSQKDIGNSYYPSLIMIGGSELKFSSPNYVVDESGEKIEVTVYRMGSSAGEVSVDYTISPETATLNEDFKGISGKLTFANLETSKSFVVDIIDDGDHEGNETVIMTLSNPGPDDSVKLGSPIKASLSIIDNDEVDAGNLSRFNQGLGYQPGAYDISAVQPTTENWNRQSRFIGSAQPFETWSIGTGRIYESPAIGSDGTIYASLYDGRLLALNPDGIKKWEFVAGEKAKSPTIGREGTIYVGSNDKHLYAINNNGEEMWKYETEGNIYSSSVIGVDGTIYVTSFDAKLYALDPDATDDYREKWAYETGGGIYGSPAVGIDGTIYIGSTDAKLYALDPDATDDKRKKWEYTTGGSIESSPVIRDNGTIYIGSNDNKLYAINREGKKEWEFVTGGKIDSSPAIGADGTVYVGSCDGNLYAINSNGSEKWVFSTGNEIEDSPIVGADGTIYVGSLDCNLYAVNKDGSKKWEFNTPRAMSSSPIIGSDGTIYAANYYGKLYAIGGKGKLQFDAEAYAVDESGVSTSITVKRVNGRDGEVTVDYSIQGGIATLGEDYTLTEGSLVFAAGETCKTINISIKEDSVFEGDETVILKLSNPVGGAALGEQETTLLSIADNDPDESGMPLFKQVQFKVTGYTVDERGSSAIITVTRTGDTDGEVTVDCVIKGGTATGGEDYTLTGESLVFGNGVTSKDITISILDDSSYEGNETVILSLESSTDGVVLGNPGEVVLTIVEDDPAEAGGTLFNQGLGYQPGAYNLKAVQPGAFNWNRQSEITGNIVNGKKWSFITDGEIDSSPVVGDDGTIYVGSRDKKLYAINADGSQKWEFATGGAVKSSSAIGFDGTIYVGSDDNKLYAINADGSKKWEFVTGGAVKSSPAFGSDGTIYVGSDDNKLYAVNGDGSKKWAFSSGGGIVSSPAVGNDGTIYVGSRDNKLYALYPDGSKKWSFASDGWVESSPAIGEDGTIYVGSLDEKLYAINHDGTEKWSFTTDDWVKASPAIGKDGTVYAGSMDGNLYAINRDGSKKWEFSTGSRIESSPVIGNDGKIYVGSYDNKLYAINPETGDKEWEIATEGQIKSSPALGLDGTIYVGSNDGKLYAMGYQPGRIQFKDANYSVKENGDEVILAVTYAGGIDGEVTVSYSTQDGTATPGQDYGAISGTLTFTGSETTQEITVPILDDSTYEGNESVTLRLSDPTGGATLGSLSTTTLTITDDEVGTGDGTPPDWAEGSRLTDEDITPAGLTLKWNAATDDTGVGAYKIYQDGEYLDTVSGDTLSYRVSGLEPGTKYNFKVQAGDAAGNWSTDGLSTTVWTITGDEVRLKLSDTAGKPGQEVNVPVTVANAAGMAGFQFTISYDAGLITNIEVDKGALIEDESNWSISTNSSPGEITVLGYNWSSEGLTVGNGELLTFIASLVDNIIEGEIVNLEFTKDSTISDTNNTSMAVSTGDGSITIFNRIKGDVNNDNDINVLDVVNTVNIALGKINPSDGEKYSADANGDGKVNVLDVANIVNMALGRK